MFLRHGAPKTPVKGNVVVLEEAAAQRALELSLETGTADQRE